VRSLRIGLLVRGPVGSAVDSATSAGSWQPLAASGSAYSFSTSTDVGTTLAVPADRRLRQQLEFTIHLRNQQF
jgi:type IV pilus assembly protein PilW